MQKQTQGALQPWGSPCQTWGSAGTTGTPTGVAGCLCWLCAIISCLPPLSLSVAIKRSALPQTLTGPPMFLHAVFAPVPLRPAGICSSLLQNGQRVCWSDVLPPRRFSATIKLLLLICMLNSSGGHHARRCNSCRWLRFPCCGQRFPCDLCHEEATDGHEMKWAHRMVRLLGAAWLMVTAWRLTEDARAVFNMRCAFALQRWLRALRSISLPVRL